MSIKPYYQDDYCTIFHGDCREILPQLEPVDLVLTDPPYGVGKAEWDGSFPGWIVDEALRVAPRLCIMPGLWALPLCVAALGSRYRWMIAGYNKNGMTHGAIGFNNWIPAIVAGNVPHGGQDAFSFVVGQDDKTAHPSPKPMPFVRFLVTRLSREGETILDPFMGSGTTLRAAKDLGRKAIGIEIEEKYCEIAVKRLRQEVFNFGT
jgi:site-specific DNA-methyltransferase (adenine-specific)